MFRIEYTSGLTVSITVTVKPGAGESWITGDPVISWGDGATTGSVLDGRAYSHTYSSYGTYTIGLDGENTCGGTAGDEESITLVEECPVPTVSFPNTPEISFAGTMATCRIRVNVGSGETLAPETLVQAWDGSGWTLLVTQLDFSLSDQTVDLEWEMTADTDYCYVTAYIKNSCGNDCSGNTEYYSYAEFCPVPTCSFRIN